MEPIDRHLLAKAQEQQRDQGARFAKLLPMLASIYVLSAGLALICKLVYKDSEYPLDQYTLITIWLGVSCIGFFAVFASFYRLDQRVSMQFKAIKTSIGTAYENFDGGVFAGLLLCIAGALFMYGQFDERQIATTEKVRKASAECSDIARHINEASGPLTNKQMRDFLNGCRNRDEASKALNLQRAALQGGGVK